MHNKNRCQPELVEGDVAILKYNLLSASPG